MTALVGVEEIEDARSRVAGVIRPTHVDRSANFSRMAGRPVILKPEHLQRTGSFKIRGAYNHISRLDGDADVVAASAGNHAQGVALAATLCGLRSVIFMPANAALPKLEATRAYGAEVRVGGDTVDDCVALARAHAAATGARFVPPFDDPWVIAGQGTVGLEIVDEAPDAAVVVVPVGGGGLIGGTAAAIKARRPDVLVVGVEAQGAPTMRAALDAGRPVMLDSVNTMADGTALRCCSELTLAHAQAFVDDVVLVTEEQVSRSYCCSSNERSGSWSPRAHWPSPPSSRAGCPATGRSSSPARGATSTRCS